MKKLRALLIGFILGGGFGAELGSFISRMMASSDSFSFIESGLLFGGLIGICLSAVVIILTTEVANK
ncbi:MAG: lipid-binding SYLF domain-containing protein [Cyclobacteriaceae bacterium]|jgi:lipid-binding SYLF domain-containing protein